MEGQKRQDTERTNDVGDGWMNLGSLLLGLTAVVLTSSGEVKAIVLLLAVLAAILVGACIIYGAEHWSKHAPENKEDKDDE